MSAFHRSAVAAVCTAIIGLTLAAKSFALWKGGGLLGADHPFFPGNYGFWMTAAVVLETAALLTWVLGRSAFLLASAVLGAAFVGYHWFDAWGGYKAPCSCLGGLFGKQFSNYESGISFALAATLLCAGFVGLIPNRMEAQAASPIASWRGALVGIIVFASLTSVFIARSDGRAIWGDEGVELTKAAMAAKGKLTAEVWNDQPPMFSQLSGAILGPKPSLTAGRILVAVLGMLVPVAIWVTLQGACPTIATSVALLAVWASQWVHMTAFQLEFPAYALALASAIPVAISATPLAWLGSALIAVASLNLKVTAAFGLVVPFTIIASRNARSAFGWGLCVVGIAAGVSIIQPAWRWDAMVQSHLASPPGGFVTGMDSKAFADLWPVILLALYGCGRRMWVSDWRPIVPWFCAAVAALVIHSIHKPFWPYYNLHIVIPIGVLAGVGFTQLMGDMKAGLGRWAFTPVALALGLWTAADLRTAWSTVPHGADLKGTNPVIAALKAYHPEGEDGFSFSPHFTAVLGITPPAEIAVLPLKRLWSRSITMRHVGDIILTRRLPTVVLGEQQYESQDLKNLKDAYSPAAQHDGTIVLVRKDILPTGIELRTQQQVLKQLGL